MALVTNVVNGSSAQRLLLLVHGYGADEQDLGGLLPYLDPDGVFAAVMPRAPLAAPGTPGYMWYDLGGAGGELTEQFTSALDELDRLVDEQCAQLGFERSQAIFAGFSQGAGLALALGLFSAPDGEPRVRPAGVLAMSPAAMTGPIDDGARAVPVLVQHGTDDPLIPVQRSRDLARDLREFGIATVYREYPMEHQVALEGLRDAHEWLTRVFAGDRPDEPVPDDPIELVPSVTTAQWEREVLQSDVPVIVDFWAPWCQPCRQVSPIVEQIASMRGSSYKVVKVNIDNEPALAQQYDVQSIPLIGMFRNGRLERKSLGLKARPQLEAELGMLVIP
ncbi:MAG TPA: thioredoxin [Acidimicrobiia bacterium]|nr:thioredoxin [Acidimicrobiia bacterium]